MTKIAFLLIVVLILAFAGFCFLQAMTDSSFFTNGIPDDQDHSIGNTLWIIAGFASVPLIGLIAYLFPTKKVA